jgi:RimJ/RimL family protein N-acetyltransferase
MKISTFDMRTLNIEDVERIRKWRNHEPETLRTPYMLTKEMQKEWYLNTICKRESRTRYFAFYWDGELRGYGGIENILWEVRTGEISILIAKQYQGMGYGKEAIIKILDYGFNNLNLNFIWGECYYCSKAVGFWKHILSPYKPIETNLPNRKYWNGKYYDSYYFQVIKENFK